MLHTKFLGNRSAGSEKIIEFFTIYGRGGHLMLGYVTTMP